MIKNHRGMAIRLTDATELERGMALSRKVMSVGWPDVRPIKWKPITEAARDLKTVGDVLLWIGCCAIGHRANGEFVLSTGEGKGLPVDPTHYAYLPEGPQ